MSLIYLTNPKYLNTHNLDLVNKHVLASDWVFFNKSLIKNKIKLNIDYSIEMSKQVSIEEKKYLEIIYSNCIENFKLIFHKNCEYLIGPWLRHTIYYSFQSWLLIQRIQKKYESIFIENKSLHYKPPRDFNSFMVEVNNGNLNEFYCYKAAEFQGLKILFHKILQETNDHNDQISFSKTYFKKNIFKNIYLLKNIISFIDGNITVQKLLNLLFVFKKTKFLIYRSRISLILFLFGNLFTKYGWKYLLIKNNIDKKEPNKILRKKILNLQNNLAKNYEKYLCIILSQTIPEIYLSKVTNDSNKFFDNKNIITSTAHWNEDRFKKILSENISVLDKFIIYQHGGTFGMTSFEFNQYIYETMIPSTYLSWGWVNKNKKIIPFIYNYPKIKLPKIFISKQIKVCVLLTRLKAFSRGDPWDNSKWNRSYTKNILEMSHYFTKLQTSFSLRVHPAQDKLISIENILSDKIKKINFDYGKMHYTKYNLYVITQNSTNLIDFLIINIPTIIFIDKVLEPSEKFTTHINNFKKNNIFHSSLDSLKTHLEFICKSKSNLNTWWNAKNTQISIKQFLKEFASTDLSNLISLKKI